MQIHVWKTTWNIWFWSVKLVLVKNRFRYRTVHQMKRKLTFHVLIWLIIWIIHSRILPTLARRRRTQSMRRVRWKTSARCNEFVYICFVNVLLRDEMICLHRQCQTLFPNSLKWKGDERRQKQINSTAGVLHLYILVQRGWRPSSMVIHAKPRDQSLLKSSGFPNQVFPRMRLHSVGGPISPQAGSERSATSLIQAAQCQVRCMTLHRPCTLAAAADRSILGRHKQRKQTIFQP